MILNFFVCFLSESYTANLSVFSFCNSNMFNISSFTKTASFTVLQFCSASSAILSPIAQWPSDGMKMFPNICLFSSKIKLLNPNMIFCFETYVEKFQKIFLFFHWNPYLKTDSANILNIFSVTDFNTNLFANLYVIFPAIMYVLHLEKPKIKKSTIQVIATVQ